jgi:hypothetical protein
MVLGSRIQWSKRHRIRDPGSATLVHSYISILLYLIRNSLGVQGAPAEPQAAQVQPGAAQGDEQDCQPVRLQSRVFPLRQGICQSLAAGATCENSHGGEAFPLSGVQQGQSVSAISV